MTSETPGQSPIMDQILGLLKSRDDTSRFVALSMTRSLLDGKVASESRTVQALWNAMPKSFLVRLLKARPSGNITADAAMNMNHLAVAVIHTFVNLLPSDAMNIPGFTIPLMQTIPYIERPQQVLAYQALHSLVSHNPEEFLNDRDAFNELGNILPNDAWHIEHVVTLLRLARLSKPLTASQIDSWISKMISLIPVTTNPKSPALIFTMLADVTDAVELSAKEKRSWSSAVLPSMKLIFMGKSTPEVYKASVTLAAALVRAGYSEELFLGDYPSPTTQAAFSERFITLILIDIRASIPSLLSSLLEPSYPATSLRLAMSLDLVAAFISQLAYLGGLEDPADDPHASDARHRNVSFSADQLLKLRQALTETFSLTLEYFRDRWDASFAGVAGLHPSARISDKSTGPLQLPWDNPVLPPAKDPMIHAGLRALALWIRDDDQPQILEQTTYIMDMLLALFSAGIEDDADELALPVIQILTSLFDKSDEAVTTFLDLDGWKILTKDLSLTASNTSTAASSSSPLRTKHTFIALTAAAASDAVHQSREPWLEWIPRTMRATKNGTSLEADSSWEACDFCVVLWEKAPTSFKRKYADVVEKLRELRDEVLG